MNKTTALIVFLIVVVVTSAYWYFYAPINLCPVSYKMVEYKPLTDAPSNFVSRITEPGNGCVIKEEIMEKYNHETLGNLQEECEKFKGTFALLDGVVIENYELEGPDSGGCWGIEAQDNIMCREYLTQEDCPENCKYIQPEIYYTDLPFCLK